jgi:hypothetical protein
MAVLLPTAAGLMLCRDPWCRSLVFRCEVAAVGLKTTGIGYRVPLRVLAVLELDDDRRGAGANVGLLRSAESFVGEQHIVALRRDLVLAVAKIVEVAVQMRF